MIRETYKIFYTGNLELNFNLGTLEAFQSSIKDFKFKVNISQLKEEFTVSFDSLYIGDLELSSESWIDCYVYDATTLIDNIIEGKGKISCYKSAKLKALAKQNLKDKVFIISGFGSELTGQQILDLLALD